MGVRGRTMLAAAVAAVLWGSAAAAPAAPVTGEGPEPEAVHQTIEEALAADLGMTMAEFVEAGALAEQVAPEVAEAGEVAVGAFSADVPLSADGVEVRGGEGAEDAGASFATIEDLRDAYLAEVGPDGLTGLAYTLEGYEVMVVDPERAHDRGAGRAEPVSPADWAARFPDVSVTATTGPGRTSASALRGGAPVSFGSVGCTHGFNGYYSGQQVGISAGHCPFFGGSNVSAGAYVGTVNWYQYGGPGSGLESYGTDLTTYRFGSAYTYPASVTTYADTVTITGRAPAVLGMPVCKTGRMTGWRCSKVNKIGWQWIGDGSGDINRPKRWVWSLFADTRVIPGDSGGPWVSGHKAVGITSSYDSYADGSPYATAALLTSLDDYRAGAQVKMWLGRPTLPSAEFSTSTTGRARWASGQVVSGTVTRLAGDSVSPGTVVEVRVDGTLVTSPSVASNGAFSFTYRGSDSARHTVTLRPRSGSSTGTTVTVTDEPAGTAPNVVRHSGGDRYGAAARIALDSFRPGVDTVYVATGATFPDALTGGALAGSQGAPVLLTRPGSLPASTADALRQLQPRRIVILGGGTAVSTDVRTALGGYASVVERIGGRDRYEVAANVARTYTATGGTVFVASGQAFPDALSAATRAGATDVPVLITRQDRLSQATAAQLERLKPSRIILVGGTTAVSATVASALSAYSPNVVRVGGTDRYEVSARLSQLYDAPTAQAWVATGADFPDALAAGAVAAANGSPVLLTRPTQLPAVTKDALVRLRAPHVHIAGGEIAVGTDVRNALRWVTYPR